MKRRIPLEAVARFPMPGDNVAIAVRRLEAGAAIECGDTGFRLDHTVLEGHRFAVWPIASGALLRSWNLPFGRAIRDIAPGSYACNEGMLEALRGRTLDFALPEAPNFIDCADLFALDEAAFQPGTQVEPMADPATFEGYDRGPRRGSGTRNYVVILGISSRTAGFVRSLAARLQEAAGRCPGIDGVVAVEHTEGGGPGPPNNQELVLRTLAGFMVHPNVGALLAVDYGTEPVNGRLLEHYALQHGYPLAETLHSFISLHESFEHCLAKGERQIRQWLARLAGTRRCRQPLSRLKIALQCGGSDAFSGISGNPLAGWAARELIRRGGSANLAETDELIGAESYVLQNVRDLETAQRFLAMIERFRERVAWHGESVEGNPSAGNKFRGLYNLALKSIGAARKRDPQVRLDYCIEYAEPMTAPGFYFMDSPGNDLESLAGQVACGCNLIFFVTGNGSVTNFPFVPTIKLVTTTARYQLLAGDMDVNAGAYLDGTPMDALGAQLLASTIAVAGGEPSRGERAGHAQVQLWRDWPQGDGSRLATLSARVRPAGQALAVRPAAAPPCRLDALCVDGRLAMDQVGLILPASLCAAQVARLAAERLNRGQAGRAAGLSRFVALAHTEGCGAVAADELYVRTALSYLVHPLVRCALVLEHGCEKIHNDYLRHRLLERGLTPERFGWASIQLDGGIEKTLEKVNEWFGQRLAELTPPVDQTVGLEALRLGVLEMGPLPPAAARSLVELIRWTVGAGGTVVVPEWSSLLHSSATTDDPWLGTATEVCLAYGEQAAGPGFYVMEAPTRHAVETFTGLGAAGVEVLLAHAGEHPLPGHPLAPLVQASAEPAVLADYGDDLDLALQGEASAWSGQLLELICQVASRRRTPRAVAQGNTGFQLTRGLLGVSL